MSHSKGHEPRKGQISLCMCTDLKLNQLMGETSELAIGLVTVSLKVDWNEPDCGPQMAQNVGLNTAIQWSAMGQHHGPIRAEDVPAHGHEMGQIKGLNAHTLGQVMGRIGTYNGPSSA